MEEGGITIKGSEIIKIVFRQCTERTLNDAKLHKKQIKFNETDSINVLKFLQIAMVEVLSNLAIKCKYKIDKWAVRERNKNIDE